MFKELSSNSDTVIMTLDEARQRFVDLGDMTGYRFACTYLGSWAQRRDAELNKADIELNKVQDGRGTGLVSDWRDYRNALRDWPEHESFPDSAFRPVFVNTDV